MDAVSCSELVDLIAAQVRARIEGRTFDEAGCVIETPFFDGSGDPIEIAIGRDGDDIVLDDTGSVAGALFSLGQHTADTPAFKLIETLAKAYQVQMDFNEGVLKLRVAPDKLTDGFLELLQVIITAVTAAPFIRVQPRRARILGPRLRTKIRREYAAQDVLTLVEPDYEVRGVTVDAWPVDFHWQIKTPEEMRDVFVVTVDLDVSESLRKAEAVAAMALDTKEAVRTNDLRVVLDTHGHNSQSDVAARFLKEHGQELKFRTFDFNQSEEKDRFVRQSVDELLGPGGAEWRELWLTGRATRPIGSA